MSAKLSSAFISHSSHELDRETTAVLAKGLQISGVTVWWDAQGLEGGQDFPATILEAIIRHHFFLYIISPRSVASSWYNRELCCAADLGKDVVRLLLEPVPTTKRPIQLAPIQYVDIRPGIAVALPAILNAMGLSYRADLTVPEDCAALGAITNWSYVSVLEFSNH